MIKVELGEEVKRRGKWRWHCTVLGVTLGGVSRQPLLDACREIKRIGEDPAVRAGLFWQGRERPSLTCTVGTGAKLTVDETRTPVLAKWKAFGK